jgi:hypothetical protein
MRGRMLDLQPKPVPITTFVSKKIVILWSLTFKRKWAPKPVPVKPDAISTLELLGIGSKTFLKDDA